MNRERLDEIKSISNLNDLSFDIFDDLITALEEAWARIAGLEKGNSKMSAQKDNKNKLNILEVPYSFINAVQRVFNFGKEKYSFMDWLKGHEDGDLLSAALRHIYRSKWEGPLDAESGLSHVSHAATCLAMYIEQEHRGTLRVQDYKPRDLPRPLDVPNPVGEPMAHGPVDPVVWRTAYCVDEKTGHIEEIEL